MVCPQQPLLGWQDYERERKPTTGLNRSHWEGSRRQQAVSFPGQGGRIMVPSVRRLGQPACHSGGYRDKHLSRERPSFYVWLPRTPAKDCFDAGLSEGRNFPFLGRGV